MMMRKTQSNVDGCSTVHALCYLDGRDWVHADDAANSNCAGEAPLSSAVPGRTQHGWDDRSQMCHQVLIIPIIIIIIVMTMMVAFVHIMKMMIVMIIKQDREENVLTIKLNLSMKLMVISTHLPPPRLICFASKCSHSLYTTVVCTLAWANKKIVHCTPHSKTKNVPTVFRAGQTTMHRNPELFHGFVLNGPLIVPGFQVSSSAQAISNGMMNDEHHQSIYHQ